MEIKATVCNFRQYGDEERKCSRCGYVIPSTNDDTKALAETIKSTGEKPLCSIKKEMTKEHIPKWVEDYYKADYKSSAGKAVKFLYEELAKEREKAKKLVEAVQSFVQASDDFNAGYINRNGEITRCGIAALSLAMTAAEKRLRLSLTEYEKL